MKKKVIDVIIDLDCGRTVEDDLALCYALAQPEMNVCAITLAPYKTRGITCSDAQIENELEVHRLLRYLGKKNYELCFQGGCGFCDELCQLSTPAVDQIIKIASRKKVNVVCLGSLTNVAMAIEKRPSIAKNLNVLWLGLRHVFHQEFNDINYSTDKKAFEIVAKSNVAITIFPSYTGKLFVVSYDKIEEDIAINQLGKYLYRRLTENVDFKKEFCRLYSILPIAYLSKIDCCYTKKLPVNMFLKDFPKTTMGKLVNYVYDLKSMELVWKDFSKKMERLSNNFAPVNYFFISDTHLGDARKYKLRQFGFETSEEMTATIIKNWNSVVSKKDIVYHLGDFGDYNMIKRLNGKVYLICGNHEKVPKGKTFEQFRQELIGLGFADVYREGIVLDKKVFGVEVYMNHFPSKTRPGMVNFFGHVHTLKPLKKMGVNVAANYHHCTPISREDMKFYINFVCDTTYSTEDFVE